MVGWWNPRVDQRWDWNVGNRSVAARSRIIIGNRLGREEPRRGVLITKRGQNSRGWNSRSAIKGIMLQARVKMVGRRSLTTTIKYLNGIVGAAQPKGINMDRGITN